MVRSSDEIGSRSLFGPVVFNRSGRSATTIVFAATANDGPFFSDNGGDGWIRPSASLPEIPFVDLAFAPGDSQRMFAAGAGGLFESEDGGQTWTDRATGPAVFRRVRFDPNDIQTTTTKKKVRPFVPWLRIMLQSSSQ